MESKKQKTDGMERLKNMWNNNKIKNVERYISNQKKIFYNRESIENTKKLQEEILSYFFNGREYHERNNII